MVVFFLLNRLHHANSRIRPSKTGSSTCYQRLILFVHFPFYILTEDIGICIFSVNMGSLSSELRSFLLMLTIFFGRLSP
jgi:hypothetical protein